MSETESKGCILMLHGFKQSDSIFYKKTSGLRKYLAKQCNYELFYPCGQIKIEANASGDYTGVEDQPETVDMYSWLIRNSVTGLSTISNEKSVVPLLNYIEENIAKKGKKLVGIIGFSQGACYTSVLIEYYSHLEIFKHLTFGVMVSGFHLTDQSILADSSSAENVAVETRVAPVKTLHVMGTLDTVVEEWKTDALYEHFEKKYGKENTDVLKHVGGHYVPNNKLFLQKLATWLESASAPKQEAAKQTPEKAEQGSDVPDIDADLLKSIDGLGL